MNPSRASLKDVAQAAGLSLSGASYALRGHGRISRETVERVRAIAQRLGYQPDLRVASLMAHVRRNRRITGRETLAYVWLNRRTASQHLRRYLKALSTGARRRAEQLGCAVEEFALDDADMSARRLSDILRARGIVGVVFAPPVEELSVSLDFRWDEFACAVIGNSDWRPALHRAGHHHYRSMVLALEKLREAGSRRPAAILSRSIHERLHGAQSAAFQLNHPRSAEARRLVQLGEPETGIRGLRVWSRERPDALVIGWPAQAAKLPEFLALAPSAKYAVTLDWWESDGVPGIQVENEAIAAAAVDLVVGQLHRNERGIPRHPTTLLIEGGWPVSLGGAR